MNDKRTGQQSAAIAELGVKVFTDRDTFSPGLLPTGQEVIEMTNFVLRPKGKGSYQCTLEEALQFVAETLREHWLWVNVYPGRLAKLYQEYKALHRTKKARQTERWNKEKLEPFLEKVRKGFNIASKDTEYVKKLEKVYGVKMTEVELKYLEDQMEGERKMYCDGFVDKRWQAQVRRRRQEAESLVRRLEKEERDKEQLLQKVEMPAEEDLETEENTEEKTDEEYQVDDNDVDGDGTEGEDKKKSRKIGEVEEKEGTKGMPANFRHIRSSIRQVTLCTVQYLCAGAYICGCQ